MNKNKLYIIVIIGLFITNLVLIGFMVLPKHGGNGSKNMRDGSHQRGASHIVVKRLQFTPEQTVAYKKLIVDHKEKIKAKDSQLKLLKQGLYNELKNEETLKKDSILGEISSTQREIEILHFNHFIKVKALCTPEQLVNFDAMVDDIGKIFRPKRRR